LLCFSFTYQASNNDLHLFFHSLGAGLIEEVRVTRDKGFGFVRYSTHEEAALAIQMGNGQLFGGRSIRVFPSDFSGFISIENFEHSCIVNI
jgi:RNA recognition motif-containing protein